MTSFEALDKIGDGGFAEVFTTKADGISYAMKILRKEKISSSARFVQEVRILSALDHPNIIKVVASSLNGPPYYFVMPLYEKSLKSLFPSIVGKEAQIIPIFSAVLNAICYAHGQGIIHRDLTPSNVLMNNENEVVLTDFGLGRVLLDEAARLTESGQSMGTRGYACPEQLQEANAKLADTRCDIYSLGIILYELYSGLLNGSHPQISDLPPKIGLLVERCLQREPRDRYQTSEHLKRAWLAVTSKGDLSAELAELKELSVKFGQADKPSVDELARFAELLAKYSENEDVIFAALIDSGAVAIAILLQATPAPTKTLLRGFIRYVLSQSWPMSRAKLYLDFCDSLAESVDDVSIRSRLIYTTMFLAQQHSRLLAPVKKRLLKPIGELVEMELQRQLALLPVKPAYDMYMQYVLLEHFPCKLREGFEEAILLERAENAQITLQDWNNFLTLLGNKDQKLFRRFKESVVEHTIRSRTILIQLRNSALDDLSYLIADLENIWLEANHNRIIFVLIP